MARIRTIKPSFASSPDVGRLSRDARLFFLQLLCHLDDEGRHRWTPKELAGVMYPYDDDVDAKTITRWTEECERGPDPMLVRYVVDGNEFVCAPKFSVHQVVNHRTASILPPPPEASRNAPVALTEASDPEVEVEVEVEPLASAAPPRERDHLFEALCEACEIDWHELTKSGRGPLNEACQQLRNVRAAPSMVHARAERYRARFPDAALTPSALVKHWASLTNDPQPRASPRGGLRQDARTAAREAAERRRPA